MTKRTIFLALVLCTVTVFSAIAIQQSKKESVTKAAKQSGPTSYKKDVVPVLKKYCLPCHTEDNLNPSELYLDSYENLVNGGKHGKPFVAGKADSSLLIQKMSTKPTFGDQMPLKRKTSFPEDTLKILKTWINQGAKKN